MVFTLVTLTLNDLGVISDRQLPFHRAANAVRPAGKTPTRAKKNAPFMYAREDVKGTYNTHDIMHSPVEKTLKILEKIINGDRLFTM